MRLPNREVRFNDEINFMRSPYNEEDPESERVFEEPESGFTTLSPTVASPTRNDPPEGSLSPQDAATWEAELPKLDVQLAGHLPEALSAAL